MINSIDYNNDNISGSSIEENSSDNNDKAMENKQ